MWPSLYRSLWKHSMMEMGLIYIALGVPVASNLFVTYTVAKALPSTLPHHNYFASSLHTRPCYARGSPEQWLSKFEQVMMSVVRQCVEVGLNSYDHSIADRQQWSLEHPGQVVLTVVSACTL